ncbi:TIGR02679 family protein [Alkalicoccus urumqiensis]|uniref:TIGR02679 family protein n=1 Tax=Alkalicoccus urumqiensis TaxID=1548213 RepID=A0A2P6MJQ9_ALKUR|nr:TIGR02679 family protein [Alkalicoccus urumqiensis]PRO66507.1 TIGR02679 family protein [Alkalicoccus urumqiensis]
MDRIRLLNDDPALQALFARLRRKYESLGRVGGTVDLRSLRPEERTAAASLLGLSEEELTRRRLSLETVERQLQSTVFEGFSLPELLEAYYGEAVLSTKEKAAQEAEAETALFASLRHRHEGISWYLDWIQDHAKDARWVRTLALSEKDVFAGWVEKLEAAYGYLKQPHDWIRLPLFAEKVTGNPHAFDRGVVGGRLLVHLLAVHRLLEKEEAFPRSGEAETALLAEWKVLRDDLWSFVTVQNVVGWKDGMKHPVWQAAVESGTVLNVPLREVVMLTEAAPARGNIVWIVENAAVASTLMDAVPEAPVLCTHGQLRTSGWVLLELLAASGSVLYYSGDLDPEGLQIAEKIASRFPENTVLWRMGADVYRRFVSTEELPAGRLAGLDSLAHPLLLETAAAMKEQKHVAYQEAWADRLEADMKEAGGRNHV